jgi:hypothetical protein
MTAMESPGVFHSCNVSLANWANSLVKGLSALAPSCNGLCSLAVALNAMAKALSAMTAKVHGCGSPTMIATTC